LRSDVEVAEELVRAAGEAVLRVGPGARQAKTSATDIVTAADVAAEEAMVDILRRERPRDGIVGEEGAAREGIDGTWVLDALDGTLNFASGLPGFCCAAARLDPSGAPVAAAVLDPMAGELYAAVAGEGARHHEPFGRAGGDRLRTAGPERLADAVIGTFAHPDKTGGPGVIEVFGRLVERAGQLRITGSGTLELAWVAAGRLHGWTQPDVYPWDWHPGALLVAAAGGAVAIVHAAGTDWQVAAANPALLTELAETLAGGYPHLRGGDGPG
jgi:fructose-1,6-bisphosphatase/inositol monophosphatase family enzyme